MENIFHFIEVYAVFYTFLKSVFDSIEDLIILIKSRRDRKASKKEES